MSSKKKGLLPRIEILIVGVFFLSFIVWAMSKCSATRSMYEEQWSADGSNLTAQSEEGENASSEEGESEYKLPVLPQKQLDSNALATTPVANNTIANTNALIQESGTTLFVTIDGLNMRSGPSLESAIIMRLPLYEEVTFLNEVTDTTQQINMGKVVADEPWIKVKHAKGHSGWVYGAGVHYYKMKYDGVHE
ncbi:MAG: SH3 domain-containing protein [Bacteroidota bacterium]